MLKEIMDKGYVSFAKHFDNWEDAVRASYQPLLQVNVVEDVYIQAVIDCIHEFGPYIVLIPGVAMPHSSQGAKGCNGTAISFMRVEEPVIFDANDEDKQARLFFSLASTDGDEHMKNIAALMETLLNEELVEALYTCTSMEELGYIVEKYES